MGFVPRKHRQNEGVQLRALLEKLPGTERDVVPVPSRPLGSDGSGFLSREEWYEVSGETEDMRPLERSRFRAFGGFQVSLPDRAAVCLEDLEAELRASGLIGPDEILRKSGNTGRKFRVQKRNVAVDGVLVHEDILSLLGPRAQAHAEGPNLSRPRRKLPNSSGEAVGPRPVHIKRGRRPAL